MFVRNRGCAPVCVEFKSVHLYFLLVHFSIHFHASWSQFLFTHLKKSKTVCKVFCNNVWMSANSHVNPELDPFLLQTIIHCFYWFLGDFFSPSVICKCFFWLFLLDFQTAFWYFYLKQCKLFPWCLDDHSLQLCASCMLKKNICLYWWLLIMWVCMCNIFLSLNKFAIL